MTPTGYACARCAWAEAVSFPKEYAYRCRKDTPVMLQERSGLAGQWPLVRAEDFCGQFTPRRDA